MATDRKVFAIAIIGFLAFTPSAYASMEELMTYCKPDAQRLCAGIAPGGGRIVKCLKAHQNEMTVGCAKALMKLKSKMGH
ncbi:MAG: cysteine rich repeat-containing protein [Pseudomonadota bacterium]